MNGKPTKIALITGGNRGIGYATAQGLIAKRYQVIITARSLDKAKQAGEKLSGNVIPVELDISSDRWTCCRCSQLLSLSPALNGATIMLADALQSKGIVVNSMCPGWVKTDMGGASAPRTPEHGADTAIWLATEASRTETGKFWRDRKVISY